MKTNVLAILVLGVCSSQGAITWVGGSSTDFWDDANWNFTGSTYDAASFNPLTPIADNILMANATGITVAVDQGLRLANGFGLTLDLSNLFVDGTSANSGINGVDDDPAMNPSTGVYSYVYLRNGSFLNTQFTAIGMNINVDGTSHMQYRGSGDPINGQSERTIVNLAVGARLTLPTQAEFMEQATTQNSDILVAGISFGLDSTVLSFSGAGPVTGTAVLVPEPSATILGLTGAGLALAWRRRRQGNA